ncbi:hypothetical protein EOL96_04815 [Candidatus Saccharibacteria bacterium]|nr:hypothetical protein [Candidatus Saccharibacteria bacterium]
MNDGTDNTGVDTATKQAVNGRDENGRFAAGNTPSTGFHTHPERRNSGKWDKDESISYWYNKLGRMSDEEFERFKPYNQNQRIALSKIRAALGSDELALRCTKEITDRTEGRPQQGIDMSIEQDNNEHIIRGFVIPTLPEHFIDKDILEQAGEELGRKILDGKNY